MYNAMVVLGIQHSDSVVYTCMPIDVCVCVYIYFFRFFSLAAYY